MRWSVPRESNESKVQCSGSVAFCQQVAVIRLISPYLADLPNGWAEESTANGDDHIVRVAVLSTLLTCVSRDCKRKLVTSKRSWSASKPTASNRDCANKYTDSLACQFAVPKRTALAEVNLMWRHLYPRYRTLFAGCRLQYNTVLACLTQYAVHPM